MNSKDCELLELAAKAAGLSLELALGASEGQSSFFIQGRPGKAWNPLTDDGDALRLAVKLDLEIIPLEGGGVDVCRTTEQEPFGEVLASETDMDKCAATRRAIVRAAARIGADTPAQGVVR